MIKHSLVPWVLILELKNNKHKFLLISLEIFEIDAKNPQIYKKAAKTIYKDDINVNCQN